MAYGERRGVHKMPGEYSIADLVGFGFAGALGIVAAVMIDMTQSESSALFTINRWFARITDMLGMGDLPLYAVILILMAIGAISVLYFQPVTMRGAFAQGFGALAILMTVAPSGLGTPLDAPDMPTILEEAEGAVASNAPQARLASSVGTVEGAAVRNSMMHNAVYTPSAEPQLRTVAFQDAATVKYNLSIQIMLPDGLKDDPDTMIRKGALRGRLHNAATGETYNVFRNSGAIITRSSDGRTLTIMTSVPGNSPTATLYTRIEAAGYAITVEEFSASAGRNNTWRIAMTPSSTPLSIQRLGQSYWF